MDFKRLQTTIVWVLAIAMGLLVITNLLSTWELIKEEYFEKSMLSILVISLGGIVILVASKIVEVKQLR